MPSCRIRGWGLALLLPAMPAGAVPGIGQQLRSVPAAGTVVCNNGFLPPALCDAPGALLGLSALLVLLVIWLQAVRIADRRKTAALARESARLLESEERFRRIFEETRQAATLLEDGRFIAANKAALALLRMGHAADLLGRSPVDLSPVVQPDGQLSAQKEAAMIRLALEQGSHRFEWEHVRHDGEPFIADVLLTAMDHGDKKLLHTAWNDISAQKQTERELAAHRQELEQRVEERTTALATLTESLRTANEQLQAIFNTSPAGILLVCDRHIMQCNQRFEELSAYSAEELIGRNNRLLYADPAAWASVGSEAYPALREGRAHVAEVEIRRRDGSTFWAKMASRAINPADLSRGIVSTVEDITEVRAAAAAVHLANVERQAIFDAATSGIVLVRQRVILRCNRRLEHMFGYGPDEMLGKSTRLWYADEASFNATSTRLNDALMQHGEYREELELVRKDGSRFWVRMSVQALDRNDRAQGSAGTFEDISAERAAIAEMTRARLLAEEAAKTKSDFLANMSHEIRTPMNAVIGMTYLALKTDPLPRQRDYLLKIQRSSQHLLGIINDILDFSKIDAGKMEVECIDFELERVLDNVAGLMAEKTSSRGLELVLDVDADVPGHLVGDPLRIGQILINYVNNAVKFTERGEVVTHVRVAAASGPGILLHFSVRDTGIGISEEQRNRLFQSFRQGDASTTRKYGGTGLGLVIAKRLAGLMEGEVGFDSAPGAGSTFWFTARVGLSEDPGRLPSSLSALPACRVLVVDDNDSARRVTATQLRRLGCSVTDAGSGPAAVAALNRAAAAGETCDLVLIDWQMPGLDGIATAHDIRRQPGPRPRLVLMLTAHQREGLLRSAHQLGVDEILIKPVMAAALSDLVQRMLQPDGVEAQPESGDGGDALPDVAALAGAQVLLVEDDELNQEVATELLHELGLAVDLAPDGATALHKVQQRAYDLVLMDMQMPVMDGLAATRAIRSLPHLQALPIVAMTANAMMGDRERCIAAGMNDHLTKPIEPQALARTLLHWIRPTPGIAPARSTPLPAPAAATGPDGVDGLDAALGLRLALGRDALYRSLLAKFIAGQADAAARIADALAAADWTSAERDAHTLKGVAAQIGAGEIRMLAADLEQAIRGRQPDAARATLQDRLASALATLIAAIRARLAQAAPPAATRAERDLAGAQTADGDAARVQAVCCSLAAQLEHDDFGCSRLLADNEALLQAALGADHARLAELIANYDFAAALACLHQALQARGIAP